MKDKNLPNDYNSLSLEELTNMANNLIEDLESQKDLEGSVEKYQNLIRLNNIIENGGWHFCNLKGPEELLYKYQNLCETDDPIHFKEKIDKRYLNLSEINSRIKKGLDIIGRDDFFTRVEVDATYPKYLLNNINDYFKWIDS